MYEQAMPICTRFQEWTKLAPLFAAFFGISFYFTKTLKHTSYQVQTRPLNSVRSAPAALLQQGPRHITRDLSNPRAPKINQVTWGSWGRDNLPTMSAAFGIGFSFALIGSLVSWKRNVVAMAAATGARPTLADTKAKFLAICDACIPNMYNIPVQELLAQHHLIRFSSKYQYDELFALGIVTVINQLLEGLPDTENERIQKAYFGALGDDLAKFKRDALELEDWSRSRGKDLSLNGNDAVTEKLKAIAGRAASSEFQYSKFFSIGLFQMLQQSGQTDPETFTALVKALNLDKEKVTKDLKVYKDLLKRLETAKDMKEKFLERERRKQQERAASKAQAAV